MEFGKPNRLVPPINISVEVLQVHNCRWVRSGDIVSMGVKDVDPEVNRRAS